VATKTQIAETVLTLLNRGQASLDERSNVLALLGALARNQLPQKITKELLGLFTKALNETDDQLRLNATLGLMMIITFDPAHQVATVKQKEELIKATLPLAKSVNQKIENSARQLLTALKVKMPD
jgi:hypothetical protein